MREPIDVMDILLRDSKSSRLAFISYIVGGVHDRTDEAVSNSDTY